MNKEPSGSDPVERVVVRKAFICIHCDGVYADAPVSQCDCLEGTGQDFIEGIITYRMEPTAIQESIKNNCDESVLVQGIISSWVISTWLHGQMPKEVRSECFCCWRPVDENGNCEHLEHCIVPLAFKMMPLPEPPKKD